MTLAFVFSACNLFQSVDEAERNHATPPPIENVKPSYDDLDWDNSYITITVECTRLLEDGVYNHIPTNIKNYVPTDGYILKSERVKISKGDTAFTILLKECKEKKIDIRYQYTSNMGYYVESINFIPHKFLDGVLGGYSGWMYNVNGKNPNFSIGSYRVVNGDKVVIYYTC